MKSFNNNNGLQIRYLKGGWNRVYSCHLAWMSFFLYPPLKNYFLTNNTDNTSHRNNFINLI